MEGKVFWKRREHVKSLSINLRIVSITDRPGTASMLNGFFRGSYCYTLCVECDLYRSVFQGNKRIIGFSFYNHSTWRGND